MSCSKRLLRSVVLMVAALLTLTAAAHAVKRP